MSAENGIAGYDDLSGLVEPYYTICVHLKSLCIPHYGIQKLKIL